MYVSVQVAYIYILCVCVPACMPVVCGGQKRVLDPLEMEL